MTKKRIIRYCFNLVIAALAFQGVSHIESPAIDGIFEIITGLSSGYVNRYGFYITWNSVMLYFIHWWYLLALIVIVSIVRWYSTRKGKAMVQDALRSRETATTASPVMTLSSPVAPAPVVNVPDRVEPEKDETAKLVNEIIFLDQDYDGPTWIRDAAPVTRDIEKTPAISQEPQQTLLLPEIAQDIPVERQHLTTGTKVALVARAIEYKARLVIAYVDREENSSTREVDPLKLYRENGDYYLKAWCHLKKDERTFRIDRIHHLKIKFPVTA